MAKKSDNELLQELLKKQEVIKNRIASIEARKRKEEDRQLTRKKILLGAYLLEKYKQDEAGFKAAIEGIENFLTRPADRQLFNLPVNS